ncbi:hypothetical protein AG1IA_09734 [Rhizoctonia solani AG-1 IA]|uniref:Uncharacterized protein n=1 Tax=Thanatephorus cucumeris (strain AG1-IA) TaxID=983506 RepID=L8WDH9_THACA|nr:hypothetical protein AG1IA_09734 [Rhizoctonia solani AG-1 IA]
MGKVKLAVHTPTGQKVTRNQDCAPRVHTQLLDAHDRLPIGKSTGQRREQGDSPHPRGCPLHAALSSLYLWHARNHHPSRPLLHGLRIRRRWPNVGLHHFPRQTQGTRRSQVCPPDRFRLGVLS